MVSPLDKLSAELGDADLAKRLAASGKASDEAMEALTLLAEQSVRMGIDYRLLGGGWHHPSARTIYRSGDHRSITCPASRSRAEESRQKLVEVIAFVADGELEAEVAVINSYIREIGMPPSCPAAQSATFPGVLAALRGELILPMRAQVECTIMRQARLDEEVREVVYTMHKEVLAGTYSEWRYSNPIGREELRGLSPKQVQLWREPTSMQHEGSIRTHEDEPGELGFFWATKIGGPSHGFDYECRCLLPLIANARHKVILVSVPTWPHHPVGRAHWRLLFTPKGKDSGQEVKEVEPRLWLETVNTDDEADDTTNSGGWDEAVLVHAVAKAEAMGVPLSVDTYDAESLRRAIKAKGGSPNVKEVRERMVLRPSAGIVEASDYLGHGHDWVNREEEATHAIARAVYRPPGC